MNNININVSVEVPDNLKVGHFKKIYNNSVLVDSSVTFPFEKVYDVMRVLYPRKGTIVSFQIM